MRRFCGSQKYFFFFFQIAFFHICYVVIVEVYFYSGYHQSAKAPSFTHRLLPLGGVVVVDGGGSSGGDLYGVTFLAWQLS